MQYSRYFSENELIASEKGAREKVSYEKVLEFVGGTQDEVAELLMDILNDVYTSESASLIKKPAISAQNAPENNFKTNNVSERYLQPTFNPQEDN